MLRAWTVTVFMLAGAASTSAQEGAPAPVPSHSASVDKIDLTAGKKVYDGTCAACHTRGISGAPRLGNQAEWAPRLAQGDAVLFTHTKQGFTGQRGFMPPKGGNPNLTDQDLHNAIAYIKSRVEVD